MLTKIRDRHMKRILWGLVLIIVPAFVLWGGLSSLRGREHNTVGTIDGRRITVNDWYEYLRLARLFSILHEISLSPKEEQGLAINFLVLLNKAKKEKIAVSDQEIVTYIKTNIFAGQTFEQEFYNNFLRYLSQQYRFTLSSRAFEESIRNIIRTQKLIAQNVSVTATDDELRTLYKQDTQKVKIAYLMIPYEKFKVEIGIAESALEEFYRQHKKQFEREEKIKLKYIVIPHDHPQLTEITAQLSAAKNLSEIGNTFSLEIKETDLMGINDPIEKIGWQPQINIIAFSLQDTEISPPLETQEGIVIIQRIKTQAAFTPSLDEIKTEVREAFIMDAARHDTELFAKELLDNIKAPGTGELKSFAKKDQLTFITTDFFGYDDYIEGIGLDERVNRIVFSLDEKEIYSQPLLLSTGAYIIQMIEKTPFDENDFNEKKNTYRLQLLQQRSEQAEQEFIRKCLNETSLTIRALPE